MKVTKRSGRQSQQSVASRLLAACAAMSFFAVHGAVIPTLENGILTLAADSSGGTYNNEIGADVSALVKTGPGTVTITRSNDSFQGSVTIEEGVISAGANNALGCRNTITVKSSAALVVTHNPNDGVQSAGMQAFMYSALVLNGDGPDGNGAFRYTNSAASDSLVHSITLESNASIGGTGRWGVCKSWRDSLSGVIDLNGKELAYKGSATFMCYDVQFKNPGRFVQNGPVTFQADNVSLLGTGGVFEQVSGKTLSFWNSRMADSSWTLEGTGDVGVKVGSTKGRWGGDLSASTNLVLTLTADNQSLTFGGKVQVGGYVDLTGCLYNNGNLAFEGGMNVAGSQGFTMNVGSKTNVLVTFSGPTNSFKMVNPNGDVTFSFVGGDLQQIRRLVCYNGSLARFENAGLVSLGNLNSLVQSIPPKRPSRIELSGKTVLDQSGSQQFYVGNNVPGETTSDNIVRWGTMRLDDGASITNSLRIGTSGRGALYSDRSSICWTSGGGNVGILGGDLKSYGALIAKDSDVAIESYLTIGENGTGFFLQDGGTTRQIQATSLTLSKSGDGYIAVRGGGVFDLSKSTFYFGSGSSGATSGGSATVTVDGNGSRFAAKTASFAWLNNFASTINLNRGGAFETDILSTQGDPSGVIGCISIDGGILAYTRQESSGMFGKVKPEQVTVFSGGATMEVRYSCNCDLGVPIRKPSGLGLSSVTLPPEVQAATNIGPIRLVVEGVGRGASAYVGFNTATGAMGSPVIDSPGYGYDNNSTVRAVSMDGLQSWLCQATFSAFAGGGLVKTGPGMLRLTVPNDYVGSTVISNGILNIEVDGALPSGLPLIMAGGTLACKTNHVTVTDLAGWGFVTGQSGVRFSVSGNIRMSGVEIAAGRFLSLLQSGTGLVSGAPAFASSSQLEIEDCDALDTDSAGYEIMRVGSRPTNTPRLSAQAAEKWSLKWNSSGTALLLKPRRGFVIVFH